MPRTPIRRSALLLVPIAAALGCATSALHSPDPAVSRCEPETAARLRFLEPRLESHARYSRRWWWAWNGVYVGGIGYGSALAATRDERGERAKEGVDAVKSAIGLGRNLLSPPHASEGVEPLQAIDTTREGGCAERLARAEEQLQRAVRDARDERRAWLPHLGNLALNLAGALVVAEGFDEGSGWGSGALGFVVGEIRIWTYPWQAESTLETYRERFPADVAQHPAWRTERRSGREVLVLD